MKSVRKGRTTTQARTRGTTRNLNESIDRDCDRAFMPALFAFTCVKRKGYESCDSQHRGDQEKWCLQAGRKIRQHRIQPQEEEIRLRGSLNDRWVWLASGSVGSEHCC